MGLWYRKTTDAAFNSMHVCTQLLDIWLQTRASENIDAGDLAGVFDSIYEIEPHPGRWALIAVRPEELRAYIRIYIKNGKEQQNMLRNKDVKLISQYVKLLKKGYVPTPIILAGAEDDFGKNGIQLIDGRHRIHSACKAGIQLIQAYIPVSELHMMDDAIYP